MKTNIFETSDKIIELIEKQEGSREDKSRIMGKVLTLAQTKSELFKEGRDADVEEVEKALQDVLKKFS